MQQLSGPSRLVFGMRKGGVGKTALTAHVAGLAAERGYRVLAVDLDPQGSLGVDLGYAGTAVDDEGEALTEAVTFNRPLRVASDIRRNLDVVVGGPKVELLAYVPADDPVEKMLGLRRALEPIWDRYDLVVIDSPPLIRPLREMGLAAAQYVVIPTHGDDASVAGVTGIAQDFLRVREANPDLELLGVVLFGMGASSKAIRAQVRSKVASGLGQVAPVFDNEIRHVESPAVNARNSGRLVHEYARELAAAEKFTDRKRGVTAAKLADDYARLTAEMLMEIERRRAATEVKAAAR